MNHSVTAQGLRYNSPTMLAIIGGSGMSKWTDLDSVRRQVIRTPYGEPSGALTFGMLRGREVVFLARHGYGHTIPPHAVNYRANIWALASQGVDEIVSIASVGGIRRDLSPQDLKAGPPINTLTACFRNIYRNPPVSLFVRTATIGDIMVWAMLGYHGSARYLADLQPANYRIHAAGLISMQGRERQLMMTAVARLHIAAFHKEQGDGVAHEAAMLDVAASYNLIGPGALQYGTGGAYPVRARLIRWRKAFTRWRKGLGKRRKPDRQPPDGR